MKRDKNLKIFTITGSKGKSIIARLINEIELSNKKDSILVDSTGSFFNNSQITTYEDSIKNFGRAPNVAPARYLHWHTTQYSQDFDNLVAILEASMGCGRNGTGIDHNIGILTNIFPIHKDTKEEVYRYKSFIFNDISEKGTYITTLDDEFCLQSLQEKVLIAKKVKKIAVSVRNYTKFEQKSIKSRYSLYDILTINQAQITSLKNGPLIDLKKYKYYFDGNNNQMIINALFVVAGTYLSVPLNCIQKSINKFSLPKNYGRYLVYQRNKKVVVIDFAHDANSLSYLLELITTVYKQRVHLITRLRNGKISQNYLDSFIGVLINSKLIKELTIYDKINSIPESIYRSNVGARKQGDLPTLLEGELKQYSLPYSPKIIMDEVEALSNAIIKGNLIVHIHNNIERVIKFLEENNFERVL
jgi:UDP-N-acetylmuramyl tripeptide synthase